MAHNIRTYADLLRQIHKDLRLQHPEWIQSNGDSPMCDFYEARLLKLIAGSTGNGCGKTAVFQGEF